MTTAAGGPLGEGEKHLRRLRSDLITGSVWTLVAALGAVPLAFLANLVLVRSLGPAEVGRYGSYVAVLAVATVVVNLGVSDATVQWLASATSRGETELQDALIRRCGGFHILVEGPVLAVVVLVVVGPASLGFALLAAVGVMLTQVFGTSSVVMSATARNAAGARIAMVSGAATQAVIATAAATSGTGVVVYSAQAFSMTLAPALGFAAVGPRFRRLILRPTVKLWPGRAFARFSAAAALSSVLGIVVFGRLELIFLQASGAQVDAGLFVLAAGLASQITVPIDSLMGPLLPTAAGLVAAEPSRAVVLLARSLRVTALGGAFTLALVIPPLAAVLPAIYGTEFSGAREAVFVLGGVSCLQSIFLPFTAFALVLRMAGAVAGVNAVALLADIALAATLIPPLGLRGAVVANSIGQLVALVLLGAAVTRRLGIRGIPVFFIVLPFLVTLALVLVSALLLSTGSPWLMGTGIVLPAAGLVLLLRTQPALQLPMHEIVQIRARLPRWAQRAAGITILLLPIAHERGRDVAT